MTEKNCDPFDAELQIRENFARDMLNEMDRKLLGIFKGGKEYLEKQEPPKEKKLNPQVTLEFNSENDPSEVILYAVRNKAGKYIHFVEDYGHGGGGLFAHPGELASRAVFTSIKDIQRCLKRVIDAPMDDWAIVKINAKLTYTQEP